jgi:predicted DNA-binding transcriptional regulator AlpA
MLSTPPTPRLLSAKQAAAYLGISMRSFDRLWRVHQLPQPVKLGRKNVWDRRTLDHFCDVNFAEGLEQVAPPFKRKSRPSA